MKTQNQVRTKPSASAAGTMLVVLAIVVGAAVWWNATHEAAPEGSGGGASTTSAAPSVASPYPAATLPSGVVPTRTEADILKITTSHIDRMAESALNVGLHPAPSGSRIQSVAAAMWSDIEAYESGASAPEVGSPDASRILWVVRAEGSFLVLRTPPGAEPFVGKSGYLLIDDETGMIMGLGTP